MVVLITCKMKEIRSNIKALEWPKHYVSFTDVHWQITPRSDVRSGRNSKLFKHVCTSMIPEKMKMIQSKIKSLE